MQASKHKYLLITVVCVVLTASSSVMAQTLVASYTLDNTLTDSEGGSDIVANGGTLGANGYSFDANKGLSLTGVVDQANYSIEMVFHLDNVEVGKIIDFDDFTSDSGYYAGNFFPFEGNPMFFDASIPGAGVPGIGQILGPTMVLENGVDAHFVVTRDGTSGQAVAYVNCVEHIRFNTANGTEATFFQNIAHFFIDESIACQNQCESSAGFVDYINIYSGPLTPSEVAILAGDTGDTDCDGVADNDDFCPNTVLPESVPTGNLRPNHWALTDGNAGFDTVAIGMGAGSGRSYTTADTAGCSCEQIIDEQGLGKGQTQHGCSIGVMDNWVRLVTP